MKERVVSDLHRRLGAAIRDCRIDLGLTQAVLADCLVWDPSDIGKVERGERQITIPTLIRFSNALNAAALAAPSSPPQMPKDRPFNLALLKVISIAFGLPPLRFVLPLDTCRHQEKDNEEDNDTVNKSERRIMEACISSSRTAPELLKTLGYKARTGNFNLGLKHLIVMDLMAMTIPSRPRSKHQKYRLTPKGKAWLATAPAVGTPDSSLSHQGGRRCP